MIFKHFGFTIGLEISQCCQNPSNNNLNTEVGLGTKITVHTPPHPPQKLYGSLQEPEINIY